MSCVFAFRNLEMPNVQHCKHSTLNFVFGPDFELLGLNKRVGLISKNQVDRIPGWKNPSLGDQKSSDGTFDLQLRRSGWYDDLQLHQKQYIRGLLRALIRVQAGQAISDNHRKFSPRAHFCSVLAQILTVFLCAPYAHICLRVLAKIGGLKMLI